jgi:hypothetical protein
MAVTAHRAINHVDEVRVSQGTRAMSRPCAHEVRSLSQEWDDLVAEKKELELKLQGFSKTAFLKEQQRIRKGKGDTLTAWVNRKSAMEEERRKVVETKNLVETRMMSIKEQVKQQARDKADVDDPRRHLFEAMLKELRAIRTLLESR